MDFHDHDNDDEEMGIPTHNPSPTHSARPKPGSGVRYRECLKNHAVAIGGNAVDGCGEFTAAGEEGTIDALRCAACNCHRNFHRKDVETGAAGFHFPYYRIPMGYLQYNQMGQQRMVAPLALTSTSGAEHSREDQDDVAAAGGSGGGGGGGGSSSAGKKRFRTKFTQEQKSKMLAFAERVGWRIQKSDEAEVEQFCEESSIKRHVFKVWMHNNKVTFGKQVMARSSPPLPDLSSQSVDH